MTKIILVIIDGLGDQPIPQLEGKTPLEAAKTPNLDILARKGLCGQVLPFLLAGQKYPSSDTCHLAIFGFDPKNNYLGRGVYEALGIGMKIKEGDVALRANFATAGRDNKIIDRRAGRIEQTEEMVKSLAGINKVKGVRFLVKKAVGHRLGLVLRPQKGEKLSANISDGDPKETGKKALKIKSLDNSAAGRYTAEVLNEFLSKAGIVLKNHRLNKERAEKGLPPANFLLVRGAGQMGRTLSFNRKYGLAAGYAASGLYRGIARALGMKEIKIKGASGFADSNLEAKFSAAKKALEKFTFVFLHIKAADNLAEDGNFSGKKSFLEKVDGEMKQVMGLKSVFLALSGDHSTCSLLKRHCNLPFPVLFYGPNVVKKGVARKFSEKNCKKGELGTISQLSLMKHLIKYSKSRKVFI